jgi:hypothetical protein
MDLRRLALAMSVTLAVLCAPAALADHWVQHKGSVILTVTGAISHSNVTPMVHFDMDRLQQIPRHVVRTSNPWQQEEAEYEGVLLRDLLAAVGSTGSVMTIYALDGYREDISAADAKTIDVILAYKQDGQYLPVRGKGPLFVVFPFSEHPALLTDTRREQSVWQVNKIVVR